MGGFEAAKACNNSHSDNNWAKVIRGIFAIFAANIELERSLPALLKIDLMKKRLPQLLLVAMLAIMAPASAQNLIFYQNTQTQSFLFKQGGGSPLVDYFISRIAQGSNKPASRTEFILVHDDIIRLTKVDATHFDVLASLGGFRLTGDLSYRGFDLSDLLVPGAVKFRLEHKTRTGTVKQGWDFQEVPLGEIPSQIANFRAVDSSAQFSTDIVAVVDKQFKYVDANRLAFDARTNLVDEYFQASPGLPALSQELALVDPMKFEQIDAQETELRRIQAKIDAIKAKGYPEKLALTAQHDPAGFLAKFNPLQAMALEKATRITDTRTRLPILFYERGLANSQAGKPALAKADFLKSIELNAKFAPAHVELARISYAEGQVPDAVNRLQFIFTDLQFDEPTRQKAVQLGTTIYQNRIGNANYAISQSEFEKALTECDLAKDLCVRVPAVKADNTLETAYGRAHRGIYLRHVANGVKAENEKRLEMAEQDGLAALDYQKKAPNYVGEPREASELLKRVRTARYDGFLASADQSVKANELAQAENLCRQAIAYQATNAADIKDATAAKAMLDRVKGMQYLEQIAAANAKALAKDHKAALELYELAKAIEKDHQFKRDTTLGTKIKVQAKQVLLANGKLGLEQAKSNRLPEAKETTSNFNRMLDQYGLTGDKELGVVRQELQDAIFSQECINANAEFSRLVNAAELKRQNKKFIEANALWTEALDYARKNSACGIVTAQVLESQTYHANAVSYQDKLKRADEAMQNVNYNGSIGMYNEAGDLFFAKGLDQQFGLSHPTLFDYVNNSGKLDFKATAAGYFCDKQSYDSALQLVYDISTKGYPKSRLKAIQARLGKELAIRDKQLEPGADPKLKAAGYTRAQKTMSGLGKAYIKQWKSM